MAIKLGTENKRQVYLLAGLFAVIVVIALYMIFSGPSKPAVNNTAQKPAANQQRAAGQTTNSNGPAAEKVADENINPELNLVRLGESEAILYGGRGRNIFSADSMPLEEMEQPLISARNNAANAPVDTTPPVPKAPPIDLKYFGYTQTRDKNLSAFFSRGEDIFIAHTGEIVDHRYKIGVITPNNVQVTDLSYKNTQPVEFSGERN
jgi:hypothetical protein